MDAVELDTPLNDPAAPVMVDGQPFGCAHAPQGATLIDAIAAACPAPVADLGKILGAQTLEAAFKDWGLGAPPLLEIPTDAGQVQVSDPGLAAIGQEALTVTPLHMAMVVAAAGNGGMMPPVHLVLEEQGVDGNWQPAPLPTQAAGVISSALAERLRSALRLSDDGRVLGRGSFALAGTDLPSHVWFLGLAPVEEPRYGVAVLLEHGGADGLAQAERVGQDALVVALSRVP
jgi:peptidoglycan glycosyltransferase